MTRVVDWFFRDRRNGAIVIGQWPNLPLWVFAVATALDWGLAPTGTFGTVLRLIGSLSLAVWALDEVARGVNPWRRILGGIVLAGMLWRLAGTV